MKRHPALIFALHLALAAAVAHAGPRSSANYSIITDTADSGGTHASSAAYGNDGSAGTATGISTVASPSETVKAGYIGQLYNITGLALSAPSSSLNETTGTLQLNASQTLDDATTLAVPAVSITWSIQSGPITSISSGGLATAATVYQNTPATVQGSYLGNSGTLNLTVINVNNDDYGIYANDGIPDSWQVQYFGLNNPQAGTNVITDGSGLNNLFKYTAGLIPNDASSTFIVTNDAVPGQPGQQNITFSPSMTDRHYTIQSSTDLSTWSTLSGPTLGTGTTQTVTDPSAGTRKFYRVQVSYP